MTKTFIGIDPGATGAVCSLSSDGEIKFLDCPVIKIGGKTRPNATLMAAGLKEFVTFNTHLIIENVHSMPKQGVASTFSFGMGFGIWLGIVAAIGIPMEFTTPQAWKKAYGLCSDKEAARVKALQLFPGQANNLKLKKHHGRAEALLLAEYLRRKS
ncbi:MAG TPA: hypothetical protein V6D21_23535 [Candidatus Obscuribacterales bacterium]